MPLLRKPASTRANIASVTNGTFSTAARAEAGLVSAQKNIKAPPATAPAIAAATCRHRRRSEKIETSDNQTSGTMKKSVASAKPQKKISATPPDPSKKLAKPEGAPAG